MHKKNFIKKIAAMSALLLLSHSAHPMQISTLARQTSTAIHSSPRIVRNTFLGLMATHMALNQFGFISQGTMCLSFGGISLIGGVLLVSLPPHRPHRTP